ncbi:MAG: hypothetical protein ACHQT9_02290 [Candidatus Saccharimonadales bacterium]
MYKGVEVFAEVKTESPFGFVSEYSWDELFAIANEVGDTISVHTNKRWGGSFDLVKRAKSLTDKPILAKGKHKTDEEVRVAIEECEADLVLVVGRVPSIYPERCLIEVETLQQLGSLSVSRRAVWNDRDLKDGSEKAVKFPEARELFPGWLLQASNVVRLDQINTTANAVLIGSQLPDVAAELRNI